MEKIDQLTEIESLTKEELGQKHKQFLRTNFIKDSWTDKNSVLVLYELYKQRENWVSYKDLQNKSNLEYPSTFGNRIFWLEEPGYIFTRRTKEFGKNGKEAIITEKGKNLMEVILEGDISSF